MNRFEQTRLPVSHKIVSVLPLAAFAVILILFLGGIRSVSDVTLAKQQESLETALDRSIAQCYALEGVYPPSLDYLTVHYGVTYDQAVFLVDYKYYGSNLLPDVTVLRRKDQKKGIPML